jgi:hypothetical protein
LHHGNRAFLSQKTSGTLQVAVAAGNLVALAREQLCEVRAGCPGSQNEDAHWGKILTHSFLAARALLSLSLRIFELFRNGLAYIFNGNMLGA